MEPLLGTYIDANGKKRKIPVAVDENGNFVISGLTLDDSGLGSFILKNGTDAGEMKVNTDGSVNVAMDGTSPITVQPSLNGAYTESSSQFNASTGVLTATGSKIAIENNGDDLTLVVNEIMIHVNADTILPPSMLNVGNFTSMTLTSTGTLNFQVFIYD